MTVVTWRLPLKVTHLLHRRAKVVQMKLGTFCTALCLCLSGYIYIYVSVCYSMCCLSQWRLLLLPQCRLMAPVSLSWMSHSTHLSFLCCPCHDAYFSTPGLEHANKSQVYISILFDNRMHTHTYTHAQREVIELWHMQVQEFYFLIELIWWLLKPPLQQHWLSLTVR